MAFCCTIPFRGYQTLNTGKLGLWFPDLRWWTIEQNGPWHWSRRCMEIWRWKRNSSSPRSIYQWPQKATPSFQQISTGDDANDLITDQCMSTSFRVICVLFFNVFLLFLLHVMPLFTKLCPLFSLYNVILIFFVSLSLIFITLAYCLVFYYYLVRPKQYQWTACWHERMGFVFSSNGNL